jgi:peptidoglycan/LPS O-acetylase OafA/YrhL
MPVRYTALDSWRGLCALLVALFHLPVKAAVLEFGLIRHGYLFVDFFFVLSGFVITHAYGAKIVSPAAAIDFLVRRWGRVWPLHVVILLVFAVLESVKYLAIHQGMLQGEAFPGGNNGWSLLTNLLLIQSWNLHDGNYWNFPSWSISAEWAAYLFFAAALLLTRRFYLGLAIAIGLACTVLAYALSPDSMDVTYDYGVLRCLSSFSLGMLVHWLHRRYAVPAVIATMAEISVALLLVLTVTLCSSGKYAHLMPLVFAATVFVFASAGGRLSILLTAAPFRKLGDWSYSLYMNHALLIFLLPSVVIMGTKLFGRGPVTVIGGRLAFDSPVLAHATVIAYLLLLVAMSAYTFHRIELPGQNWFKTLATRLSTPRPAPLID